jgi:hypothetical protein
MVFDPLKEYFDTIFDVSICGRIDNEEEDKTKQEKTNYYLYGTRPPLRLQFFFVHLLLA